VSILEQILIAIAVAMISALITYYFVTKNILQKAYQEASKAAGEAIEHHIAVLHQDSMYKYVESELKKYDEGRAAEIKATIASLSASVGTMSQKLQHMEIKEVKSAMVLKSVAIMVGNISKKLNLGDMDINALLDDGE
jgi:flagellar biosynthesis regulator FlaF